MKTNKTILVTGASSGVGQTVCTSFLRKGWQVVATMRDTGAFEGSETSSLSVLALDVTDPGSIDRALATTIARYGKVDAVINNAGYGEFGVFEGISDERVRSNFEVNVFGVMNVLRSVLPQMREQRQGTIVNISSGGGMIGLPATSVYLATKFALEGFTESIWYELSALGITIKLVEPGGIDTPFIQKIAAQDQVNIPPAIYRPVQQRIRARMGELSWKRSTAEEIADVVFEAVTDGKGQRRYFHGPGIEHLVAARRTAGEAEYERVIRSELGFAQSVE